MMSTDNFSYIIPKNFGWPPAEKPKTPFGPSLVEIIRSCPLRSCFGCSSGYESKMDFYARVGIAFHHTQQSFFENKLPPDKEQAIDEAKKRFYSELNRQKNTATSRAREKYLPHDETRIERALEALILESLRLVEIGDYIITKNLINHQNFESSDVSFIQKEEIPIGYISVEVPVKSDDGILKGRIDRVEQTEDGVIIYDYKSSLRDDLPIRYHRQVQLYAYMWRQTYGNWPKTAYVVYPLLSKSYEVVVDPTSCNNVAEEAKKIIHDLEAEKNIGKLAIPGDTCKVCEYRPWCLSFWTWQSNITSRITAYERASLGFSGHIIYVDLKNHRWHLQIAWNNSIIRLSAPEERLPQLKLASLGQSVLVLDTKIQGSPISPIAIFSEYSELFLLI